MVIRIKENKIPEESKDVTLMVAFTVQQLHLCYSKLVMYPEMQESIKKLISKLNTI